MNRSTFVSLALLFAGTALASKPVANRTYVQSGPDGVFYARCVPAEDKGTKGTTTIYQVHKDADEVVDRYDWYCPENVVLGWSPKAGKVAVMADLQSTGGKDKAAPRLSFYLGGKFVKSYDSAELTKLGAATVVIVSIGERVAFRTLGCEQVPGTNDYRFGIEVDGGKKVWFDVLTGDVTAGPG